jgi:predicted HAD superfamily Cof-like phosphohydrolase|tara:strand:- start:665 stop:1039 length:375 start_codon:yes stop_codon:yes gene_type:complete
MIMNYQKDVEDFMESGQQDFPDLQGMTSKQAKLYMDLITEEYNETWRAFNVDKDIVEVADGLADMVWVIMGMASTLDIPFDKVWNEVKASNMSKFVNGKVVKNSDGKIMKPEGYFRPNIGDILA